MPAPISTAFTACNDMTARRQQGIETLIPLDVGSLIPADIMRYDFKNSAERIARSAAPVDFRFHTLFGFGIRAVEQNFVLIP